MIVDVRFVAGESINSAVEKALKFAEKNDCFVHFEFNGFHMLVNQLSDNFNADASVFIDQYYKMLDERIRTNKERLENEES